MAILGVPDHRSLLISRDNLPHLSLPLHTGLTSKHQPSLEAGSVSPTPALTTLCGRRTSLTNSTQRCSVKEQEPPLAPRQEATVPQPCSLP